MKTSTLLLSGLVVILFVSNLVHGSDDSDASDRQSRYSLKNLLSSTKSVIFGMAQRTKIKLPTAEEIFDGGKQLIAGYPLAYLVKEMNKICSAVLTSKKVVPKYTPDITKMNFQLFTQCHRHQYPILETEKLLNSPDFHPDKNIVIFASGWKQNANETDVIKTMAQAYRCRGDTNFIAVDAAYFADTLYSWSAFNTDEIGKLVAEGLEKLSEAVPLENIHLIGHSLGAHIVGAAGRYFTEKTRKVIPRITGLDPARPCFNEGEELGGLQRGDAAFIDIIHSNPGILGKPEPLGDVDFYPGGLVPLTPGCSNFHCAHARAFEYYAESTYPGNEFNFMGRRCTSLSNIRDGKCPGKDYPMGYATPYNLKGNYFLEVRSESPFGEKGDKQRSEALAQCGVCKDIENWDQVV